MVDVSLSPMGVGWQFLDDSGRILSGGRLYTFEAGSTAPIASYTTSSGNVSNGVYVQLDSAGRPPAEIWQVQGQDYKYVLKKFVSTGVYSDIRTYDHVPGIGPGFEALASTTTPSGASLIGVLGGGTVQDYITNPGYGGAITATFGAPAFSNLAYYSSAQYLTNGATPGTWYSDNFAGNFSTEGFTAAIVVPSTATNYQSNGSAIYLRSERSQLANGGDVGGFIMAISAEDDCVVFPQNTIAIDTAAKTGQILSSEFDWNVSAPDTDVNGSNQVIVSTTGGALTGSRIAYAARGAFHAASQWSQGYLTEDGAIELYATYFGSQTAVAGTNRDSQKAAWVSYNSSNTRFIATMLGDSTGGMALRPGSASGAVAFQDPTGSSNWAFINVDGVTSAKFNFGLLTFSQLPSAASSAGTRAMISDGSTATFNATVAGGGGNIIPVFSDGTNWRVG